MKKLFPSIGVAGLLALGTALGGGCKLSADLEGALSITFHGVAQAVPPEGTTGVPSTSPIVIFADAVYGTVTFKVEQTVGGQTTDITADVVMNKVTSGADKDIFVFSALGGFTPGASVKITLSGTIEQEVNFTVDSTPLPAVTELGFEASSLPSGWAGFGDIDIIATTGSLVVPEGTYQLALSSGTALGGAAIAGTSSLVASGEIDPAGGTTLDFQYNFQSSEFDDYCDSAFDDTLVVVVAGPNDAVAHMVDSVNVVCAEGSQVDASFPGMPDDGDSVYKESGLQSFSVDISGLGSPITVAYILTDVGDSILTTVAGIDNLTFQ